MTAVKALQNAFKFDRESPWHFYRKTILWSFVVSVCLMVPFLIHSLIETGSAVFTYYGDYNAQQICFYEHCVDMVRNGDFGWDWVTDMGANFVGSYSYYMLGSPFFWMMCAFPSSWAPYLMAPMYIVKYIFAAVLAYAYLQRFVKNKNYAVIGAMLYSFSGFQIYNTFFNQFHDVVAFFPLLLIGMEEYVQNDRKGIFAIAVALNAVINYFMFAGQVAFCVLYFIARLSTKSFKITIKKFIGLVFESVMGFLMAMFLFLPAASALMGNDRISNSYLGTLETAINEMLEKDWDAAWKSFKKLLVWETGGDWYWQRYGQIFESYFFPPDIPSRVNFFHGHETRWASISMYLPMFGLSGVFALFTTKKRGWLKGLMILLVICSFVPILNSMFFLFNSAYYARWLYLMIMMFSLATTVALEDNRCTWKIPNFIMTVFCTGIAVGLGLIWHENDKDIFELGYPPYRSRFWLYVGLGFLGIILTAFIIRKYRGTKMFERATLIAVSCMTVLYGCIHMVNGKSYGEKTEYMVDQIIEGYVELPDPHEEFYRIDEFRTSSISTIDNLGLYWNYPTIENFHTVVPPSISAFYDKALGVRRSVGSRPESDLYGLRSFTSVKYSLIETKENKKTVTKTKKDPETGAETKYKETVKAHNTFGFEYLESQNGFDIYENKNYIPMGFAYTEFMTESDFETKYTAETRHILLCKYLIVPDEAADYYSQFMTRVVVDDGAPANQTTFKEAVAERQEMCCDTFEYNSYGFTASINLDSPNVVYFSVPAEEHGWTATVNGEEAEVLDVTYGFVAVEVPAGTSEIKFDYDTPGMFVSTTITLSEKDFNIPGGAWISLGAFVVFVIYMLYFKVLKKQKAETKFFSFEYYDDMAAYDEDTESISDDIANEEITENVSEPLAIPDEPQEEVSTEDAETLTEAPEAVENGSEPSDNSQEESSEEV